MIRKIYLTSFLTLLIPLSVFAYTSPGKPTGFVNDFAKVLSVQEKQDIEAKLISLNRELSVEIAAVTIPALGDETIETYAVKLFQEWGIGGKEKDTGLLILVAPNDRQVRIEVGYGLEGAVTDIQSGNIIRTVMTPAFKEGKYGAGISGAVDALDLIITKSPEAAQYSVLAQTKPTNPFSGISFQWGAFIVIIFFNIFARILGKSKSWWLGGVLGAIAGAIIGVIFGFFYAGLIGIIVLTILGLIFDFIVSKNPPGSGRGGGFWPIFLGGGRGGSSGGFGGFGGGMSGGGGASGRFRLIGGCADEAQVLLLNL